MDDPLDDVKDAQSRLSEVVQLMRDIVDRVVASARQLEAARAEVAEKRKQAHNVLQTAQRDAEMILESAKANADEIAARARKQLAEANATRGD
jgi:hypothetical protein